MQQSILAGDSAATAAPGKPVIRPARVGDMPEVQKLIAGFAEMDLMLPKTLEHISRNFREFAVAVSPEGEILGCGALRVYTPQLAEIASLAVSEAAQGLGIGRLVVERLESDSVMLGIGTVFALTLNDGFFHRLGYRTVPKEMFPPKVWADCRSCSKLHACDEIAVVKDTNELM